MLNVYLGKKTCKARFFLSKNGCYFFTLNEEGYVLHDLTKNNTDSVLIFNKVKYFYEECGIKSFLKDSLYYVFKPIGNSDGLVIYQLKVFNVNAPAFKRRDQSYLYYHDALLNSVPPINSYFISLFYKDILLKGPAYFDFTISDDTIKSYIYVHDKKQIEVFALPNDSRLDGGAKRESVTRTWGMTSSFSIILNGPFKIINRKNKVYLLTQQGIIYALENNEAVRYGEIKKDYLGYAVVNDTKKKEVYLVEPDNLLKINKVKSMRRYVSRVGIKLIDKRIYRN